MRISNVLCFTCERSVTFFYVILILIILSPGCSEEEQIIELNPDAGQNYLNIENEGYVVRLDAQAAPSGQKGTWKVLSGENGSFDAIDDPKTFFRGEPGEEYELAWELSSGGNTAYSTIIVSFKPLNPVVITNISGTLHNNISALLLAERARFGASGEWEIINGQGARLETTDTDEVLFIGKELQPYTVRWTLTYGSKKEFTELVFSTDELRADAGQDQLDIKTDTDEISRFHTLDAYLPPGASGEWDLISGETGKLHSAASPAALFEGVTDSIYTLIWQIAIDEYNATDTLQLRFRGKWGMWTDERDGQTYRFVELNGLEWMAENYNNAIQPGEGSWYYGYAERAVTNDGYPLETEADRKKYGRLYSFYAARDQAPEGWRLPTAEEFNLLINSQGGELYAKEKLVEGGESGLELNYPGTLEFSSGADPAFRNVFSGQDRSGLFWTQSVNENNGYGIVYSINQSGGQVDPIVAQVVYYALSVRYVREAQN